MRRKQDCGEIQADGDEPGHFCSYKFFISEQSDCVEKPGDTQSFKWTGWIIRETWCKRESRFRDWNFGRGMLNCSKVQGLVKTDKDQKSLNRQENQS